MSLRRVFLCCLASLHLTSAHQHPKPFVVVIAGSGADQDPQTTTNPAELPLEDSKGISATQTGQSPPTPAGVCPTAVTDTAAYSGPDISDLSLSDGISGGSGLSPLELTLEDPLGYSGGSDGGSSPPADYEPPSQDDGGDGQSGSGSGSGSSGSGTGTDSGSGNESGSSSGNSGPGVSPGMPESGGASTMTLSLSLLCALLVLNLAF